MKQNEKFKSIEYYFLVQIIKMYYNNFKKALEELEFFTLYIKVLGEY